MSVPIPARFEASTDQAVTRSLVRAVLFEFLPRWNRGSFRWTDASRPFTYAPIGSDIEIPFAPDWAPTMSAIRKERGARPSTMEIEGALAPPNRSDLGLVVEDFTIDRVADARVTHRWVDAERPWSPSPYLDQFYVEDYEYDDTRFRLTLASLLGRIGKRRGRQLSRKCANELGQGVNGRGACTVPLDGANPFEQFRISGASTSNFPGTSRSVIAALFTGHPKPQFFIADWFKHGTLVCTSGSNAGISRKIRSSTDATQPIQGSTHRLDLTLYESFPFNVTGGVDTFDVIVGCDRRYSTCKSKFPIFADVGNRKQFVGEPYVIGTDRLIRSGDAT